MNSRTWWICGLAAGVIAVILLLRLLSQPTERVASPAATRPDAGRTATPSRAGSDDAGASAVAAVAGTPAAGTPAAAPMPEDLEPWISARIRPFPRKKTLDWQVDIDGDGRPEKLRAAQRPADDRWRGGETPGGPVASMEVRDGRTGAVVLERRRLGYALGYFGLAVRLEGGRHVVFSQEGAVDGPSELPGWLAAAADGTVRWHEMPLVPLTLLDVAGDGRDAVVVLSKELYQDFLPRGTMDLLAWRGGRFVSVLPFVTFELCPLEPDGDVPLRIVAVTRKKSTLHLLDWDVRQKKFVSTQQVKVSPPDDGVPYNVSRGFALACSFPRERPHRVEYKNRRFVIASDGRLVEQAKARPIGGR